MKRRADTVTRDMAFTFGIGIPVCVAILIAGNLLGWSQGAIGTVIILVGSATIAIVLESLDKQRPPQRHR